MSRIFSFENILIIALYNTLYTNFNKKGISQMTSLFHFNYIIYYAMD